MHSYINLIYSNLVVTSVVIVLGLEDSENSKTYPLLMELSLVGERDV